MIVNGIVTLHSIREKTKKQIAQQKVFTEIIDALPKQINPTKICEHVAFASCFVECSVETLDDAIELSRQTDALPMVKYQDAFCSFRAKEGLRDKDLERADVLDIEPIIYRIHGLKNQDEFEAIWYIKVGKYVVEIRATVQKPKVKRYNFCRRTRANKVIENNWQVIPKDAGPINSSMSNHTVFSECMRLASGDHTNATPNSFILWGHIDTI